MNTTLIPIDLEQYLKTEQHNQIRHEMVEGQLFMMAGATDRHNIIAGNIFAAMHRPSMQSKCQIFMSDMKVVILEKPPIAYYPDLMVNCNKEDNNSLFRTQPCLIVEVLSDSTETTDRREKKSNYRKIPSLKTYLIVHQNKQCVEINTRNQHGEWVTAIIEDDTDIQLECPKVVLTLKQIYESIGGE
jgi:Uma2 family endonuclease